MAKQAKGKIINIASNVARVPAARMFLPYACSKGAVYTLTHALARELGQSGINVMLSDRDLRLPKPAWPSRTVDQTFKFATADQSIQRREQTEDLVGTAVFLASAASDFISGQVIFVDGGTVML